MIELTRRGFIKLGASAAGLSIIGTKFYSETSDKDWVTDSGDFYTVIIPDYKTINNERFDKPVLLIMGKYSRAESCRFDGFVNIQSKGNEPAFFRENRVDLNGFTPAARSMVAINVTGKNIQLLDSAIFTRGQVDCDIRFNSPGPLVMPPSGIYIHTDQV